MVTIRDVGWSSFGGYEGGRYVGNKKYLLPEIPTFYEKVMFVVSSSEGNCGSVNCYDRAICSIGLIQWIELGQYGVSNMLGYITEQVGTELVLSYLKPALALAKATFKKTSKGLWRFHFIDGSGKEVVADTEATSRWLFSKGSGKIGTWTEDSKFWNKVWVSCIASLLEDDRTIPHQVNYTAPKLQSFVLSQGKSIVFSEESSYEGYAGALKALLIAYGVNLPAIAEKTIAAAAARSKFPKWTKQWCLDLMHDLALTSGVAIWPGRYDYKRPALERAFGIILPKNQLELSKRAWASEPLETIDSVAAPVIESPVERPHVEETMPAAETVVERPTRQPTPVIRPKSILETLRGVSNSILGKLKL